MTLTWIDILVIAVPFGIVLAVSTILKGYVRSVADFLAAGRCAGRYLICTANAELGAGATGMVQALEVFAAAGFTTYLWASFEIVIMMTLALNGVVSYRFRETRSLTFHQFFEVRYSKGVRMLASFLSFFSGAISFAIQPVLGARFIVYFCNFPPYVHLGSMQIETAGVLMLILLSVALYMTMTGGQISVMLTNCMEGLVSGVFYLFVAISILLAVSYVKMQFVMVHGAPGQSHVNPLDISSNAEFGPSYVLMILGMRLFVYRGSAWQAGFAAAARTPHEGKMAGILTTWRGIGSGLMTTLLGLSAVTLLHHPDYAAQAAVVAHRVAGLSKTMQVEMQMPAALGLLLPAGARGALCACMVYGMFAGLGGQMHANGTTFVQDVILPFRKTPLKPKEQIRWLRGSVIGMALFGLVFGLVYRMPGKVLFVLQIMGAIYMCIGAVVWGGLYWKKGTTAGAWTSLIIGGSFAILAFLVSSLWQTGFALECVTWSRHLGWERLANYLSHHTDEFPIRLQVLTCISYAGAGISYIVVSLLTCRQPYNLDKLLHRGKYRVEGTIPVEGEKRPSVVKRLLGFNQDYTRTDKFIALFALCWTLTWCSGFITILLWNLLIHRWSAMAWCRWSFVKEVWAALIVGGFATTWFTIGGVRDVLSLFRSLKAERLDYTDNGMVAAPPPAVVSIPSQLNSAQTATAIEDAGEVALNDK
jgi:SSS family solute:Na+ symporter